MTVLAAIDPNLRSVDLQALAQQAIAEVGPGDDAARVALFRQRALDAYGGKVPASELDRYARALLTVAAPKNRVAEFRAGLDPQAPVLAARKTIARMDTKLELLEAANLRAYQASSAALTSIMDELSSVITSRAHSDDRVSAFFGMVANNGRRQQLDTSWKAYQAKNLELRGALQELRKAERELTTENAPGDELGIDRFAAQERAVQSLLTNLQEQIALLKVLIAHASSNHRELSSVQVELETLLAETRAWAEEARSDRAGQVLERLFDLAGLALMALSSPAAQLFAKPALALLRSFVLDDVEGARATVESLVRTALGRLLTDGLIDAGVNEVLAKAITDALKEASSAILTSSRS